MHRLLVVAAALSTLFVSACCRRGYGAVHGSTVYERSAYVYSGGHPVPGGAWCSLDAQHEHPYSPMIGLYVYVDGAHRYQEHTVSTPASVGAPPLPNRPPAHATSPIVHPRPPAPTFPTTPPAHEQLPPGHVHVPPGHAKVPPGQVHVPPGHAKVPPGQVHVPPGHAKVPPGQAHVPPGHAKVSPGHAHVPPGHAKVPPGQVSAPPGHSKLPPGHATPPADQTNTAPAKVPPGQARPAKQDGESREKPKRAENDARRERERQ
jgi:hypothetical protein